MSIYSAIYAYYGGMSKGRNEDDEAAAVASMAAHPARLHVLRQLCGIQDGEALSSSEAWPNGVSDASASAHLRKFMAPLVTSARRAREPALYRLKPGLRASVVKLIEALDEIADYERRASQPPTVIVLREVSLEDLITDLGYDVEPIPFGVRVGHIQVRRGDQPGWIAIQSSEDAPAIDVVEEELGAKLNELLDD